MTSLLQRVKDIFRPAQNTADAKPTTATLASSAPVGGAGPVEMFQRFGAETERVGVIRSCRMMYKADPRVRKMHKMLARDTVRGGFAIRTDDATARDIAIAMHTRLGLNQRCEDFTRLTARDGDSFIEVEIDDDLDISGISRKATLKMHRNTNDADRFVDPQRAFWMENGVFAAAWGGSDIPKDAIAFADWQMIHARWDHDDENRYGTPMMAAATSAFKRVTEGETDIAVRRKTRAGVRYSHVIEGSPADVEAYKEVNAAALASPYAGILDFYSNKKGEINLIQGDARLSEIGDILHHIETLATGSDVPLALVGYGNDLNRDVLGEKKAEYEETLDQTREWVSDQIIKPLFERQLLLKGIYPASVKYSIVWRPRIQVTPTLIRDLADALLKLKLLNVPDSDINSILTYFLPGVSVDALLGAGGTGGNSERLAEMLKGLSI